MSPGDRRPLVIGNWKMNLTELWAVALVEDLLRRLGDTGSVEVAVAPAFPCLHVVGEHVRASSIRLGAQDVHWEESGPWTGEVSSRMLSEMGVRFVLVGHSERRTHFAETDERVQRKVEALRRHSLVPVLCLGETEHQRDEGRTLAVVERQLRLGLGTVAVESGAEVVIAYEPVWAIGTGRTATPDQVGEVHRMIREQLGAMFGLDASGRIRILYGGSITPENAAGLFALEEVDGGLVGGASLDGAKFTAIVGAARG